MQHVPFRRTLAVLFAFRDFCLAERVFDSHFGFSGHHFDVHPELSDHHSSIMRTSARRMLRTSPGTSGSRATFCSITAAIPAWRAAAGKM